MKKKKKYSSEKYGGSRRKTKYKKKDSVKQDLQKDVKRDSKDSKKDVERSDEKNNKKDKKKVSKKSVEKKPVEETSVPVGHKKVKLMFLEKHYFQNQLKKKKKLKSYHLEANALKNLDQNYPVMIKNLILSYLFWVQWLFLYLLL
jgi:beta-lactamase class A